MKKSDRTQDTGNIIEKRSRGTPHYIRVFWHRSQETDHQSAGKRRVQTKGCSYQLIRFISITKLNLDRQSYMMVVDLSHF